jgi:hypothetical protein
VLLVSPDGWHGWLHVSDVTIEPMEVTDDDA